MREEVSRAPFSLPPQPAAGFPPPVGSPATDGARSSLSARAKMGDGTARRREAHPCFFFAGLNRDLNEMDAIGTSVLSQEERLAARESLRRFVSFEEFGRIRGRAVVSEEERRALSFLDPDSGNVLPSYAIPAACAVPAGESFWRERLRHVELDYKEHRQAACALRASAGKIWRERLAVATTSAGASSGAGPIRSQGMAAQETGEKTPNPSEHPVP